MMLHYVREAVFELCDVVGVVIDDSFAQAKEKLTANFMHRSYAASWGSSTTITIAQLEKHLSTGSSNSTSTDVHSSYKQITSRCMDS